MEITARVKKKKRKSAPWGSGLAGWWITEAAPVKLASTGSERYQLSQRSAMFQEFSRVPPTLDGVVRFANKNGLLDVREAAASLIWVPESRRYWYGERLSDWVFHITRMRSARDVWELARLGDSETLSRRFRYDARTRVLIYRETKRDSVGPRFSEVVLRGESDDEVVERYQRGVDFVELAFLYVTKLMNQGLRSLRGRRGAQTSERVRAFPQLRWDASTRLPVLELRPTSLIAALWLQFAHALTGGKEFRACRECGTWFEIGEKREGQKRRGRDTRRYCTDSCRIRRYNRNN